MKIQIREQDPLKQGLKLGIIIVPNYIIRIREQDPLKQGLKLQKWLIGSPGMIYS